MLLKILKSLNKILELQALSRLFTNNKHLHGCLGIYASIRMKSKLLLSNRVVNEIYTEWHL